MATSKDASVVTAPVSTVVASVTGIKTGCARLDQIFQDLEAALEAHVVAEKMLAQIVTTLATLSEDFQKSRSNMDLVGQHLVEACDQIKRAT